MNNIKRNNIIILGTAILAVILIFVISLNSNLNTKKTTKKEEKLTANTNENVITETEIDGIKIDNITLLMNGNSSTFSCNITNITNEEITKKLIIIFKSSSGQEITSLEGYYGNKISSGETKKINASINKNLNESIVKSVEYKLE